MTAPASFYVPVDVEDAFKTARVMAAKPWVLASFFNENLGDNRELYFMVARDGSSIVLEAQLIWRFSGCRIPVAEWTLLSSGDPSQPGRHDPQMRTDDYAASHTVVLGKTRCGEFRPSVEALWVEHLSSRRT